MLSTVSLVKIGKPAVELGEVVGDSLAIHSVSVSRSGTGFLLLVVQDDGMHFR